jgi:hypothetical protein
VYHRESGTVGACSVEATMTGCDILIDSFGDAEGRVPFVAEGAGGSYRPA